MPLNDRGKLGLVNVMIMGVDRIFFCPDLYEIYKTIWHMLNILVIFHLLLFLAHQSRRWCEFIFFFGKGGGVLIPIGPRKIWEKKIVAVSSPKFEWCDLPDTRSGLFNIVSNATANVLFCCPCIKNLSYMSVNNFINVASCYRFSCYCRFSDIAINSVNPSFIWRLEFSKNG